MSYHTTRYLRKYPLDSTAESFHFVAKHYEPRVAPSKGLTLLFFHCTGSHKEVWEPIIQYLFDKQAGSTSASAVVREAWTFDWPNHGEAGRLNAAALALMKDHLLATELVNRVKRFAEEGFFDGRTLVGIGLSSGATSLVLTTIDGNDGQPGLVYKALAILEPSMFTRAVIIKTRPDFANRMRILQTAISKRKNTWESREEARSYFGTRVPWKTWDPKVLDLFIEHALMETTSRRDDGLTATQVTLCCPPFQEQSAYGHSDIHYAATERIPSLDPSIAVHYIFGARPEVIPQYARDSVLALRPVASVRYIPGAGHLVVQEKPGVVASAIWRIIEGVGAGIRATLWQTEAPCLIVFNVVSPEAIVTTTASVRGRTMDCILIHRTVSLRAGSISFGVPDVPAFSKKQPVQIHHSASNPSA